MINRDSIRCITFGNIQLKLLLLTKYKRIRTINASIITIGNELMINQTIDTNSALIGQELNKIGIWLKRRIAVGDVKEEILHALNEQSKDNDLIIITGGLGPTVDDITKPALCEYFNANLIVDESVLQH